MNDYADERPRRRKIPWKWIIILGIVGLLIGAYATYRIILNRRVRKQLDAIRAQGYPVTLDELAAWYPEPQGENAASLFHDAFFEYQKWPSDKPDLPVVGTADLPERGDPLPEDMRQNIADYLEMNAEALKLLHIAAGVEECRYDLNFRDGYGMRLPHLAELRQACRLLYLEGILSAETGDTEQAAQSIISSLGAGRSVQNEPIIISHLVHLACNHIGRISLEYVLNRVAFNDAQLLRLQEAFKKADNPDGILRAMASERCVGIAAYDGQIQLFGTEMEKPVAFEAYRASGILDIDFHHYLEIMNGLVDITQMPSFDRLEAGDGIMQRIEGLPKVCIFTRMLAPGLLRAIEEDLKNKAGLQTAVAALAVERYRLAEGKLPNRLEDLVPKFLDDIPADPFDSKPLRYRQLDKGYLICSIGPDGEDNSGAKRGQENNWDTDYDIPFHVER